jgi:20S proteasome alpha/beta subunit
LTVVVGFVGDGCAVMAADSEATESGHTRFDVEKIWTFGDALLLAWSGNGAVRDAIARAVQETLSIAFPDTRDIPRLQAENLLTQIVQPVLTQYYSRVVSTSRRPEEIVGGVLLVIGHDPDGYWLLEIDQNNTPTFYGEDRGYQAIGSGGSAAFVAQGLLEHYAPREQTIEELRLIAYRTVKTCIDGLGGQLGVGGEVRIWSCTDGGGYERAGKELMASLGEGLTKWTTIERESLTQVWGEAPQPGDGGSMPGPLEGDAGPPDQA